jgi:hypothetical protein
MKKVVLFLSAFLLINIMGFSQEIPADKVPAQVKQGFDKKFTGVTPTKYVLDKRNYVISFKDNDVDKSASFTSFGRWVDTKVTIAESDLPKKVTKSIAKNFKGYEISDLATVETTTVKLVYQMNLKSEKLGYQVQFSPKGDILRKMLLKKEKEVKAEPEKK